MAAVVARAAFVARPAAAAGSPLAVALLAWRRALGVLRLLPSHRVGLAAGRGAAALLAGRTPNY